MIQEVLLLTKSKKNNGLCVAGINKRNGEWIRLNFKGESSIPFDKFKYPDGSTPKLLDTILVNIQENCPTELHPEDVIIDPALITKTTDNDIKLLENRIKKDSNEHEYIYYDEYYKLDKKYYPDTGEEGAYSLIAIIPEEMVLLKKDNHRILAGFKYNGVKYKDLRVTDIDIIDQFKEAEEGARIKVEEKVCLVISLGEEFYNQYNNRYEYYKLVASVIEIGSLFENSIIKSGDACPEGMSDTEFLETIVGGKDPFTGETINENSLLRNNIVIKALIDATYQEKANKSSSIKHKKPFAAGTPWTDEEDSKLDEEFAEGIPIDEIAEIHGRTKFAIQSRLMKHGLIELV